MRTALSALVLRTYARKNLWSLKKWFVPILDMRGFQERKIRADAHNVKYDQMLRSAQNEQVTHQ
jgi:hypothetical protein